MLEQKNNFKRSVSKVEGEAVHHSDVERNMGLEEAKKVRLDSGLWSRVDGVSDE